MSESKTSQRRILAVEKQRKALELRKAGVPFSVIAEQLCYRGPSGAYRAVMSALRRTLQEPADEVRQLETERLDALLLALWPHAKSGNQGAIDRALKVMERRAKLWGLDMPVRADITSGGRPLTIALTWGDNNGNGNGNSDTKAIPTPEAA